MGGAWGKRDGAWGGERGSRRDARGGEPGRAASSPKDLGLWRRDPSIEGVELVRGLGLQVVHMCCIFISTERAMCCIFSPKLCL